MTDQHPIIPPSELIAQSTNTAMTLTRVNIKEILADPGLRAELVKGAADFICKVEGINQATAQVENTKGGDSDG